MKCIKCGNELAENAQFCTNCGAPQEQNNTAANPVYEQSAPNTITPDQPSMTFAPQKSKVDLSFIIKLVINAMGVLSGVLSIIMGVVINFKDCGDYVVSNSYGGDAYTGIQNAAADTAMNILASNRILTDGFSFICVSIGLAVVFYFAAKLLDTILAKKSAKDGGNK